MCGRLFDQVSDQAGSVRATLLCVLQKLSEMVEMVERERATSTRFPAGALPCGDGSWCVEIVHTFTHPLIPFLSFRTGSLTRKTGETECINDIISPQRGVHLKRPQSPILLRRSRCARAKTPLSLDH